MRAHARMHAHTLARTRMRACTHAHTNLYSESGAEAIVKCLSPHRLYPGVGTCTAAPLGQVYQPGIIGRVNLVMLAVAGVNNNKSVAN